jgi:probable F420-dependent oxidoreductase
VAPSGKRVGPAFGIRVITQEANDPSRWREVIDQARAAEAAGADRVIVSGEHVVFGEHLEAYGRPELGGRPGGKLEIGPDAAFPDPVVAMAAVCATTQTIRVMNSLMLAALRRPIVLAKAVATLDALSGGRIDLSVGIGWQREEYGAAGVPFERRGRLLDHTLEVCQALWTQDRAGYSSPELSFDAIHMRPKPVQTPKPLREAGVPIWVSGTVNPGAMRRLARFGTGWNPWGLEQDAVIPAIPRMREAVAAFGRDPDEIEVLGHLPVVRDAHGQPQVQPSIENLAPMLEAGVTNVDVFLSIPSEFAAAEEYLSPWVEAFRKAST